jgi:hypothetical protein
VGLVQAAKLVSRTPAVRYLQHVGGTYHRLQRVLRDDSLIQGDPHHVEIPVLLGVDE